MYKLPIMSVYSFQGDLNATLNSLTGAVSTTSKTLADLSTDQSSLDNQAIFMNQPMSWWLECLNTGSVKYTPVSNLVNWSYVDNTVAYYVNMPISNLLIPNAAESSVVDPLTKKMTITHVPKLGMSRVDTYTSAMTPPEA